MPSIITGLLSIVVWAGCAGTAIQPSTGEYLDDSIITSSVVSELAQSDDTSALSIEVETFRGVVQLSGFVDSANEKDAAARIAEGVAGVRRVENDIIVKYYY
ncbi:MAG: BON domain-containing protein [Gammaproteobacteria bacterium]